jgi:putative nucleotidyltransferase with HDIG domain
MNQRSKRIGGILLALAAVSALHFLSSTIGAGAHLWHIFLARLYFLPIVAAAVWFGFGAALATALAASALYALHGWSNWPDAMIRMEQAGELVSFLILAVVAGALSSWERRSRDRARRAERRAERERIGTAVAALTETLAARDPDTGEHSKRVAVLAETFGAFLGLPPIQNRSLYLAGLLHDIGKIGIRDDVLLKAGSLSAEEQSRIREHPKIALKILEPLGFEKVIRCIAVHHENMDGTGYPEGLKGEEIPLLGRVLSIVDTYDALQSSRPYKDPLPPTEVRLAMTAMAGSKLDPELLKVFWRFVSVSGIFVEPDEPVETDGGDDSGPAVARQA